MTLFREKDGKRLHIKGRLMGESLVGKSFIAGLGTTGRASLFPDVNILKVGGQSICDRGAKALPAILDEIAENRARHKMLITTGGGTRSRHIYAIGLELGMPTGILAKFGNSISEQNALLVTMVLAARGGIKIAHDDIVKLPNYLADGGIPITHGMPPYDYFALPPARGRIPIHRTDVGTIVLADLIGARSCIFIKDERGLYTDDPKKNPNAEFIPEIGARTLMERDLEDLVVERPCLEILQNSEVVKHIDIINGLEKGNITRTLKGEHVGTRIYKE